ncbi:hypothetical protein H8E65_09200 [Candidatus Bathyarchaeota archaeon]|nr:hypothetical protein [Candidatus Bathyarchaeota archaeon]MBL7080125.1 hypothetical protein [Candidatus Bathyarchaeota archaeon]
MSLASFTMVALGQVPEGSVSLEIVTTPEPAFNQIEYGESYQFDVLVDNLNFDIEEGAFIDPSEREFRFSGNLILYISFTVSKEGVLHVGPGSRSYVTALEEWDTSYDIAMPEIGGSNALPFQYSSTRGYDSRVGVDEWVTFTVDAQLYVEQYRESEGEKRYYLGDLVGEQILKYYVTSRSKVDYVGDVLDAVDWELTRARAAIAEVEGQLGYSLNVDLRGLEALQTTMGAAIEEGDYVTAMGLYEGYEPAWRDNLEEKLLAEAEEKQTLESALEDASEHLEDLTQNFQTIEAALADLTASHRLEVQELDAALSAAKTNGRLYLFGIVIALAGLVLVFLRSSRTKPAPVVP